MGQTGFCEKLRFPAKSAVSCGFPRKSAPPKCCNSQEKRKSAKISENLRQTANLAPFVPFSLSLLFPLSGEPKEGMARFEKGALSPKLHQATADGRPPQTRLRFCQESVQAETCPPSREAYSPAGHDYRTNSEQVLICNSTTARLLI